MTGGAGDDATAKGADRPRTVRLGDADVARIGLGTNRLRDTPDHVAFVREAVAAGIGYVDTAHTYTGGESEAAIGAALGGAADGPVVGTKVGYARGHGRPEVIRAQVEESLARLRTDCLALVYLHRVDPGTPLEESVGALADERTGGRIRHVALSQVGVEEIDRARRIVPVAAVQNHYNLSERGSDDVVDHCTREGIAFVPFFPLKGGHPAQAGIARGHGATPEQVALAWLLRRSPAVLPIPGTLSVAHVRENLGALDVELSDGELEALRAEPEPATRRAP